MTLPNGSIMPVGFWKSIRSTSLSRTFSCKERADEYLKKITLTDDFGPVHFYLLPFLKPAYVRRLFPGEEINVL